MVSPSPMRRRRTATTRSTPTRRDLRQIERGVDRRRRRAARAPPVVRREHAAPRRRRAARCGRSVARARAAAPASRSSASRARTRSPNPVRTRGRRRSAAADASGSSWRVSCSFIVPPPATRLPDEHMGRGVSPVPSARATVATAPCPRARRESARPRASNTPGTSEHHDRAVLLAQPLDRRAHEARSSLASTSPSGPRAARASRSRSRRG